MPELYKFEFPDHDYEAYREKVDDFLEMIKDYYKQYTRNNTHTIDHGVGDSVPGFIEVLSGDKKMTTLHILEQKYDPQMDKLKHFKKVFSRQSQLTRTDRALADNILREISVSPKYFTLVSSFNGCTGEPLSCTYYKGNFREEGWVFNQKNIDQEYDLKDLSPNNFPLSKAYQSLDYALDQIKRKKRNSEKLKEKDEYEKLERILTIITQFNLFIVDI